MHMQTFRFGKRLTKIYLNNQAKTIDKIKIKKTNIT